MSRRSEKHRISDPVRDPDDRSRRRRRDGSRRREESDEREYREARTLNNGEMEFTWSNTYPAGIKFEHALRNF